MSTEHVVNVNDRNIPALYRLNGFFRMTVLKARVWH